MITSKDVALKILQVGKAGFITQEEGFEKLDECIALIDAHVAHKLTVKDSVAMQRFQESIGKYEEGIAREKETLSKLDTIEASDDVLYELQIRRDALKKCYEKMFNK